MGRAYNVIDADGHILEPLDLWDNYIDPAFRDRAPRVVKGENGKERLVIEEQAVGDGQRGIGRIGAVGARQGVVEADTMAYKDGKPGGFDPHKRIPDMDADGILPPSSIPVSACFQAPYTIRNSPPRRAVPTTVGLPITASPIPTACSAWRCCHCKMSI
jgi:hypothetical protein